MASYAARKDRARLSTPPLLHHPEIRLLSKWYSWLRQKGASVEGPFVRDSRTSIYLRDPDGVIIEITAPNKGEVSEDYALEAFRDPPTIGGVTSEMKLTTFHHASPLTYDPETTAKFFEKFLGLTNKFTIPNSDQTGTNILGIGNEDRPGFLRYLAISKPPEGYVGEGSIHHIAMAVEDDEAQQKILKRLNEVGIENSGIIDRFWFHSLYFHDPDGNLLEIATKNPGYSADEPPEKLGTSLVLPRWLEPRRAEIESAQKRAAENTQGKGPPDYPGVHSPPEAM